MKFTNSFVNILGKMVVMASERLAPSIEEEFAEGKFDVRPVEERYYTKKYSCDDSDDGVYTFLVHSNKLCVIKLAETHPIFVKNLTVKSVNFQVRLFRAATSVANYNRMQLCSVIISQCGFM